MVIGCGGVFTINTKHHAGKNIWVAGRTMLVDGQREQYIPKAEGAGKVARLLGERRLHPVPVHPLIVHLDPKRIMMKAQPERVRVLNSHEVRRWLKHQPQSLNADAVSDLLAVVDEPSLWRATDSGDRARARRQFSKLHAEVRVARGRRRLWTFAGVVGPLALPAGLLVSPPAGVPLLLGAASG
ncbi:hypothetical protein GY24_05240 [Microterricola pindariensis]|uniref:NERD domain-containing protein n=1 Tax=Microterricola pindariensis TaxID=478010 RepID=A0ABX5AXE1_9MICO|nr:hypothetical protein GY24_05240 [Microterricola pindariensis]